MKLVRPRPKPPQETVLPLINIVFLLLIFFMIAGRLSQSDPFPVDPTQSVSKAIPEQRTHLIMMAADGALAFDGSQIGEARLLDHLSKAVLKDPGAVLHLKVDSRANAGDVVRFMEKIRGTGVARVKLLTVLETGG